MIQGANLRALSGGVTTDKVFAMVEEIRKSCETPLVFMTYVNVVFSYGTERFMKQASEAGMNIAKDKYHWEKKLHNFSKTMGSNRKNDAVYSWQKEHIGGICHEKEILFMFTDCSYAAWWMWKYSFFGRYNIADIGKE